MRVDALRAAVREVEAYAAERGWDGPPRLFALADTASLLGAAPELASTLGVDDTPPAGSLTPIEQEIDPSRPLEDLLLEVDWPQAVAGCAAVVERLVLPPGADAVMPEDEQDAAAYAATHPDRQEVRLVAGVLRGGARHCVLRLRAHDDPESLIEGEDVVPTLLELLTATLEPHPEGGP